MVLSVVFSVLGYILGITWINNILWILLFGIKFNKNLYKSNHLQEYMALQIHSYFVRVVSYDLALIIISFLLIIKFIPDNLLYFVSGILFNIVCDIFDKPFTDSIDNIKTYCRVTIKHLLFDSKAVDYIEKTYNINILNKENKKK